MNSIQERSNFIIEQLNESNILIQSIDEPFFEPVRYVLEKHFKKIMDAVLAIKNMTETGDIKLEKENKDLREIISELNKMANKLTSALEKELKKKININKRKKNGNDN